MVETILKEILKELAKMRKALEKIANKQQEVRGLSKEEAVLTLMDRTLKYFVTAGLIIVVGFGLLFLIGYIIDVVKKRKETKT